MEITAIIGPMFSGKSSRAIELMSIFANLGLKCLYITYNKDIRYPKHDSGIETHRGLFIENTNNITCIHVSHLYQLLTQSKKGGDDQRINISDYDVICIDEAQFYPDIIPFVNDMKYSNKRLIISGLISDYKMEKFGQILDILPLCSKIEHLTSYCKICAENDNFVDAPFTARISELLYKGIEVIGGKDKYYPTCLQHHPFNNT